MKTNPKLNIENQGEKNCWKISIKTSIDLKVANIQLHT